MEAATSAFSAIEKCIRLAKLVHGYMKVPDEMKIFAGNLKRVAVDLGKLVEERDKKFSGLVLYGDLDYVDDTISSTTVVLDTIQNKLTSSGDRTMWIFKDKNDLEYARSELDACHRSLGHALTSCAARTSNYSLREIDTPPYSRLPRRMPQVGLQHERSRVNVPHISHKASRSSGNLSIDLESRASGQQLLSILPATENLARKSSSDLYSDHFDQDHHDSLPTTQNLLQNHHASPTTTKNDVPNLSTDLRNETPLRSLQADTHVSESPDQEHPPDSPVKYFLRGGEGSWSRDLQTDKDDEWQKTVLASMFAKAEEI